MTQLDLFPPDPELRNAFEAGYALGRRDALNGIRKHTAIAYRTWVETREDARHPFEREPQDA